LENSFANRLRIARWLHFQYSRFKNRHIFVFLRVQTARRARGLAAIFFSFLGRFFHFRNRKIDFLHENCMIFTTRATRYTPA
jgi:hypothetical protein